VLAEWIGADLIVVGSTRRTRLGRVVLGDDTCSALDGAPCAVAVAPAGYAEHPKAMREIGVAYDESPESRHALEIARDLAREQGAKLSAFEVVELPVYAANTGGYATTMTLSEQFLADTRGRIESLGDVGGHAVFGVPGEELTVYSASLGLLVVGSRGYGPIGRLVHGSTTRYLLHHARCPLLAITKAVRTADEAAAEQIVAAAAE
jgi:nucleotide-binding universal stress UspA family protein